MAKKNIGPLCFALAILFSLPAFVRAQDADRYNEAQELVSQAGEAVEQGKLDEGLAILKQALELSPKDPDIRMDYAMVFFIKGQKFFQLSPDSTKKFFDQAKDQLISAIKLYKSDPEADPKNFLKSQCYFMLGDIYYYAYKSDDRAKELYQKSIEYNPNNAGAQEALKKLKVYER